MLSKLKRFFEDNISFEGGSGSDPAHRIQLATAALLVEVMNSDDEEHPIEQQTMHRALSELFLLSETEANTLLALAAEEATDAIDYHQFTRLINDHYSYEQKVQIIELLWKVAYADNTLDAYEDHTIRKIAELLYVRHSDFVATKLRVSQH
ncbi:MAG: TerB family tellurite resistance protein [Gammaproteobacteria bacterium]|nr:TerB family tellurite resistance protein [Gammaproteobacteria bacterium]